MPTYTSINRVYGSVVRSRFSVPHCFDTYYKVRSIVVHFHSGQTDDGFDKQQEHVATTVNKE
jgi:hypothetical protein